MVGAAGDVIVSPFDHQDVLSLLFELVAHVVHAVAQMFHQDLLAGDFGTVNADQEHVPACRTGQEEERVKRSALMWCCEIIYSCPVHKTVCTSQFPPNDYQRLILHIFSLLPTQVSKCSAHSVGKC